MLSEVTQEPARTDGEGIKPQNGAKSHLEDLHVELVDHILRCLNICDIASLRLTSRAMAKKATQPTFTSIFKHKEIILSTESLENMARVTAEGRIGCLLEHCTIEGIATSTTVKSAVQNTTTRHLQLLTQAFRNIKQYSPDGKLISICLRVTALEKDFRGKFFKPRSFRSQTAVQAAASGTFKLVMEALRQSELCIEELDIYYSLRGCSLGIEDFMTNFTPPNVLGSLKRLSVSLCATQIVQQWRIDEEAENKAHVQVPGRHRRWRPHEALLAISHVLRKTQSLESLKAHWYLFGETNEPELFDPGSKEVIARDSDKAINLKECSLHGIWVPANELLQFLQATQLERLTLTDINLLRGTYEPVFEYLTSPACSIKSYHLDDLDQFPNALSHQPLVHFTNVSGEPQLPFLNENVGPSTLIRTGRAAKQPISYHIPQLRLPISAAAVRWSQKRQQMYGGRMTYLSYDFISLNSPEGEAQVDSSSSSNTE